MSSLFRACERVAVLSAALFVPSILQAQTTGAPAVGSVGAQYSVTGGLVGDQVKPVAALTAGGGYVAWQDSTIDGDGWGIAATKLDQSLSPVGGRFRVNSIGLADQVNPAIAPLANGGAVFVWQGGTNNLTRIYARFLQPNGSFTTTSDILVNTNTTTSSITPRVATLTDGGVVVVWASYGMDDAANTDNQLASMLGVYAQRFDPTGNKLGPEFLVNQTVAFNQRDPSIAALADGNYAVAWTSESLSGIGTGNVIVHGVNVIYSKFTPAGVNLTGEVQGNEDLNTCATPEIAPTSDGGFTIGWVERDSDNTANSFDVYARPVATTGYPSADAFLVNAYTYGNQFAPKLITAGNIQLVVWSSTGQGGVRQGVYGRFVSGGALSSGEFRVNTVTNTPSQDPSGAGIPTGGFLVLWDGYQPGGYGYEIFAQRFQNSWPALPPPTVTPLNSSQFELTWNVLQGFNNVAYLVYMDASPAVRTTLTNWFSPNNLAAGSLHTFRLGYSTDGVVSPTVSTPATGVTLTTKVTPSQTETVAQTVVGGELELSWVTVPGSSYQLQYLNGATWVNVGSPRKASGKSDYIFVKQKKGTYQYRVIKL